MTMAISVTLEYQESLLLWSTFRDYETKILFYCEICHTVVSTLENSLLETQSVLGKQLQTFILYVNGFWGFII